MISSIMPRLRGGTCFCAFLAAACRAAEQDVCFEGYVMDRYCIDRGTLLDRPDLSTLESPGEHSVHCLVDVPNCYQVAKRVIWRAISLTCTLTFPHIHLFHQRGFFPSHASFYCTHATHSCPPPIHFDPLEWLRNSCEPAARRWRHTLPRVHSRRRRK